MNASRPTVDEVIGTLKRTGDPTLLAEGIDDIVMLRRFEEEFFESGLSILPLGGRSAVLEIFERRDELPADVMILFLADKDLWVYTGVPDNFDDCRILFTDGYSIENDLYRDGDFERLLSASERASFESYLMDFLKWYALSLARNLRGEEVALSTHPRAILQVPISLAASTELRPGELEPRDELAQLSVDYRRLLRGKSLMALLVMQLSHSQRPVKHSVRSLMEHGAVAGGPFVQRIRAWLEAHL